MRGYDEWKLSTPYDDECQLCQNYRRHDCLNCGGDGEVADGVECPICEGTGKVDCECQDEPDPDDARLRRWKEDGLP